MGHEAYPALIYVLDLRLFVQVERDPFSQVELCVGKGIIFMERYCRQALGTLLYIVVLTETLILESNTLNIKFLCLKSVLTIHFNSRMKNGLYCNTNFKHLTLKFSVA